MKIYLLLQNELTGYDTYDSIVVVAKDEETAKTIHPSEYYNDPRKEAWEDNYTWASKPENVSAYLIGEASASFDKEEIICASFNAG